MVAKRALVLLFLSVLAIGPCLAGELTREQRQRADAIAEEARQWAGLLSGRDYLTIAQKLVSVRAVLDKMIREEGVDAGALEYVSATLKWYEDQLRQRAANDAQVIALLDSAREPAKPRTYSEVQAALRECHPLESSEKWALLAAKVAELEKEADRLAATGTSAQDLSGIRLQLIEFRTKCLDHAGDNPIVAKTLGEKPRAAGSIQLTAAQEAAAKSVASWLDTAEKHMAEKDYGQLAGVLRGMDGWFGRLVETGVTPEYPQYKLLKQRHEKLLARWAEIQKTSEVQAGADAQIAEKLNKLGESVRETLEQPSGDRFAEKILALGGMEAMAVFEAATNDLEALASTGESAGQVKLAAGNVRGDIEKIKGRVAEAATEIGRKGDALITVAGSAKDTYTRIVKARQAEAAADLVLKYKPDDGWSARIKAKVEDLIPKATNDPANASLPEKGYYSADAGEIEAAVGKLVTEQLPDAKVQKVVLTSIWMPIDRWEKAGGKWDYVLARYLDAAVGYASGEKSLVAPVTIRQVSQDGKFLPPQLYRLSKDAYAIDGARLSP
jgi:hypothetical protein